MRAHPSQVGERKLSFYMVCDLFAVGCKFKNDFEVLWTGFINKEIFIYQQLI